MIQDKVHYLYTKSEIKYSTALDDYKNMLDKLKELFSKNLNVFKFISDKFYPQILHYSKKDKRGILYNKVSNGVSFDETIASKYGLISNDQFLFAINTICKEVNKSFVYVKSLIKMDAENKYYIIIETKYDQFYLKDIVADRNSALVVNSEMFIKERDKYIDKIIKEIKKHDIGKFYKVSYDTPKKITFNTKDENNNLKTIYKYNNDKNGPFIYKNKFNKHRNYALKISPYLKDSDFKHFFYDIERPEYIKYFAYMNLLYYLEETVLKNNNLSIIYFNNIDETFNLYLTMKPYCLIK